ncbi:FHA domain-containing protein [Pleurostoma richardsiae]|uniref:FHA domain-containing protein n=1 Tax=Pleurostoma richardsiae TaxID=41990 RepID=A0AA38VJ96_9PEZI|nr:FHA domain-containing protein [Pleurostoma richardsiae]
MTAVASPPSFSTISRPAWGINGGQSLSSMNPDEVRGMFMPRKTVPRTNSSSSISSTSSTSSTSTVSSANGQANGSQVSPAGDLSGWPSATPRKRPQTKGQWPAGRAEGGTELGRMPSARPQLANGANGAPAMHVASPMMQNQAQMSAQRPLAEPLAPGQPVLFLLSLNGTFDRKTISVPFFPETLRIGRQTNMKTLPTATNGYFDSKVLSRQHAEIWADRQGKIWIRDVKSSNGTFVNGTRLSQENRESEPHELQAQDHLELGIDIVSEDQKSVVHHKVAAKVEHAGFLPPSSNLLDVNFMDLDPTSGSMMSQAGGMQFRGRMGSQASIGTNGRVAPPPNMMNGQANGIPHQRGSGFWVAPITTEVIVKRLQQDLRNARLQSYDIGRTGQFINALLSKEDVKNTDKPEAPEPPKSHMANGTNVSFRSDGKPRFSDPPAPPPQQPLPEKPDVARPHGPDAPSLKRGTTERPRSVPSSTSPIRPDNLSQVIQLTEALNNAKREMDTQTAKMRDLEEMLQKEREAREAAEVLAKRLEDEAALRVNGSAKAMGDESVLEQAFEPPAETVLPHGEPENRAGLEPKTLEPSAAVLQARMEAMILDMRDMKEQLQAYKQRAETAEAERDADRKTLAEMVLQIRRRDEEAQRAATESKKRSPSKSRRRSLIMGSSDAGEAPRSSDLASGQSDSITEDTAGEPTLSRANTITPTPGASGKLTQDHLVMQGIPYASMISVVLLGVGLMAYINGWQPQPRLDQ